MNNKKSSKGVGEAQTPPNTPDALTRLLKKGANGSLRFEGSPEELIEVINAVNRAVHGGGGDADEGTRMVRAPERVERDGVGNADPTERQGTLNHDSLVEINGLDWDLGKVMHCVENALDSHASEAKRLLSEAIGQLGGALTSPHDLSVESYEYSMREALEALAGVQNHQAQLISALEIALQWREGCEVHLDLSDNDGAERRDGAA